MNIIGYFEDAVKAILGDNVSVGDQPQDNIEVEEDAGGQIIAIILKNPFSGNFNVLGFQRNLTKYMEENMNSDVAQTVKDISIVVSMDGPAAVKAPVDDMHTQDPVPPVSEPVVEETTEEDSDVEESDKNSDEEDQY